MPVEFAIDDLSAPEVRVLGVLVEKEMTTPEYYPMSTNAIMVACNQKTNRSPVVAYSENEVSQVVDQLQRKRLVGILSGSHQRVVKYRHTLAETLDLTTGDLAVLNVLMLRGPQTAGEIRGRTGRMYDFADIDHVETVLDRLAARPSPLVARRHPKPGQKETRYVHLLGNEPELMNDDPVVSSDPERISTLEDEIAGLKDRLQTLEETFRQFREQFE